MWSSRVDGGVLQAHYRMARLRRVYEHVLENCFTALADHGWLRTGIGPMFAARATMAFALALTVRERTVRTMQGDTHDDEPISDLHHLIRSFLTEIPE